MGELTPDILSTPSGTKDVQTDKLTMGVNMCGKEFSGSTGVLTQVGFTE